MAHDVNPYAYHGTMTAVRGAQVDLSASPVDIARNRAASLYPTDMFAQDRFLERFGQIRIAELRGRDTWWLWREALEQGDTVLVAAHVEGAAAAHREGARLGRNMMLEAGR